MHTETRNGVCERREYKTKAKATSSVIDFLLSAQFLCDSEPTHFLCSSVECKK